MVSLAFSATGQRTAHYTAFTYSVQSMFGPSENYPEIAGGIDTLSYDGRSHYVPGFKDSRVFTLKYGWVPTLVKWQSRLKWELTAAYSTQEVGIVKQVNRDEQPYYTSGLLALRCAAMVQLSDPEKRGIYGFHVGLFAGLLLPLNYELDETAARSYGYDQPGFNLQFSWGAVYQYLQRIGKKGIFATAEMGITLPGAAGGIGTIRLNEDSEYEVLCERIRSYSYYAGIGAGFKFK